jgi:ACS family hexuronate transporter-like MFS transporter
MIKIRGLRWYIAILLCLVTTINYLDRTSLSVANVSFRKELNINDQQYAYIIMCFQFSYLVMQPVMGRILDWLGTKKGFSLAAVWWSIANMLHAFARTPLSFGVFRALLGVGEAGNFPGVAKTISEWFPAKERTIAFGIANIGSGTGSLIATPFVAWIIYKYGWQEAFVITGAVGFIWVVLWHLFYKSPSKHKFITQEELDYITQGQKELQAEEKPEIKNVWKLVLGQRNFWGIALSRFLSEPAWQFYSYWIPIYFATQRGMNLKQIGLFLWIPFLAADIGSFVGGFISPFYHKLGFKILTSRKLAMTTAACMMPVSILIIQAPSAGWAIFWFCIAAFGHQCISAVLLVLPVDLFPKSTVATANGLSGTCGHFGGMLFTFSVGWLVTHIGYSPVFVTIALLDLIGAVVLWTVIREPKTETPSVTA